MSVSPQLAWMLDSSTFINCLLIEAAPLVVKLRAPIHFPEYVFRVELGLNARRQTREKAEELVKGETVTIKRLTVADLERMADLAAPRRVGLGEVACAILAERLKGGVLCDDRKARRWLSDRLNILGWESIEDILMDAAIRLEVTEYDLVDFQSKLGAGRYQCRFDLRLEFLQRRLNQRLP